MLLVRIPQEIRKYKEKIAFGLTARQIVCSILTLGICVPLYWFGRNYIPSDLLGWLILIIAVPLGGIGFLKFNGLHLEKLVMIIIKRQLIMPVRRLFKSENHFLKWQEEYEKQENPQKLFSKSKQRRMEYQASLERIVVMEEANQRGDTNFDITSYELVTVSGRKSSQQERKRPQGSEGRANKNQKSALINRAEDIERKMAENPRHVLTKKEHKTLKSSRNQNNSSRKKEINSKKKAAAKKSQRMKRRRIVKTTIPKSTQQTIPFIADYAEGLFETTVGKYSKMYQVKDINYKTSKIEEKENIFVRLGEFYNYFSEEVHVQVVVDNRFVSKDEQERKIFYPSTGDSYDMHREEYNNILRRQLAAGNNDIQTEKFVLVTIDAHSPVEALLRFHKIDAEVLENLRRIGSDGEVLGTTERLAYYHDKFRKGREGDFKIDYDFIKEQGISSKDYVAPTYFEFQRRHLQIEDDYYRVLFLNNLPSSLSDEFLADLCQNDFAVTTSMSIQPLAQDKAFRMVRRQLTGIEANKIDAEKRAVKGGYSPETIQHSIKDAHAQALELYNDMINKNQKMFLVTFTFMVHGATLDELDAHCRILESKARKYTTQLQTLSSQQEEGFKITLPFGYQPKDVAVNRALTTESLSIFMPFSNQELFQPGGFFYGLNQISNNLVVINRTAMKTPSGFVLGTSGSGKSFATKMEMLNVLLNDADTSVLIIDPENEYGDFAKAFGGTVIKISPDSPNNINPMDMTEEYGLDETDGPDTPMEVKKDKALKKKSEYIMSIVERMISMGNSADSASITPVQKTIIDRCVKRCYQSYLDNDFDPIFLPTLKELQTELDKEKESEEGRLIAEGIEYYTRGSMDIFSHKTNVNVDNRLMVFNVRDLGEQLRQVGLIIVFDYIWNKMIENKNKGHRTYTYCDEIHVMFQSFYSANFLKQLYKRGRKYGLCITGLTQNVEDLLRSEQARGMIGNSDFIMMLNQNSEDLKILAHMLGISDSQFNYVFGADAGSGLIFAENVIVPFVNRFPSSSYLYNLMSTKFGENLSLQEIEERISKIISSGHNIEAAEV